MSYLRFLAENARFLGFGFLIAFSSTFGQTFYIAMYGAEIRTEFGLGHGEFGTLYAAGTMASGLLIIGVGALIDRIDLRLYAPALAACMAGACALLGSASGPLTLVLAIFALRICGQGLMSQAATVSMARYFDADTRGRAVSVAALGFPTGQALFPPMAVVMLAALPWREVWFASAAAVAVVLPLTLLGLLRGHGDRHARLLARRERAGEPSNAARPADETEAIRRRADWSRGQVLRDGRFYLAMLAMLAPSFIITGLNFHQVHLVEVKGWALELYAGTFAAYATCQVLMSVATGIAIDRYGSVRLVPFYLLPLGCACLALGAFDSSLALLAFMMLAGTSGGAGATLLATLWAELYGVTHLGAIKALVAGLAVISSALAPALFGIAIDAGMSINTLAVACGLYALAGAALLGFVFRVMRTPDRAAA